MQNDDPANDYDRVFYAALAIVGTAVGSNRRDLRILAAMGGLARCCPSSTGQLIGFAAQSVALCTAVVESIREARNVRDEPRLRHG